MFFSINKVLIFGVLNSDPEIRYMSNGKSVTTISVITKSFYRDKINNEFKPKSDWHRIVLYNKLSEITASHFTKGSYVYVEGFLRNSKWQDKNGLIRYTIEIIATDAKVFNDYNSDNISQINDSKKDFYSLDKENAKFSEDDIPF